MGEPMPAAPEGGDPSEEKRGFFSNPVVRIIGIIAAVVILLGLVGIVFFIVTGVMFVDDVMDEMAEQMESVTATQTAGAESSSDASGTAPDPVDLDSFFTFRDIFEPLVIEPVESASSGATGTAAGTTTNTDTTAASSTEGKLTADVSSGTLYLEAIVIENGVPTAVLLWNGDEYRLTEGDSIPSTPWQVVQINDSSVVMLYGDQQVILSVGQGTAR
jgi:type IV pilus biogenesis protein PilP